MVTTNTIKQDVFNLIQKDFNFSIQDRLRIVSDLEMFKWKEDESVWKQKRGKSSEEFGIYWDNEWICDFDTVDTKDIVRIRFLTGFKKAYEEGRVMINLSLKKELDQEKEKKIKEINTVELKNINSPEEKLIAEAVKRQAKKRGKNVVIS